MEEADELSTIGPRWKHCFPHKPRTVQDIDLKQVGGRKKLSTPPTATTNFLSKTEQQA
jgi:hypothetical protein